MARSSKQKPQALTADRVTRALDEGRTKTALELAHALYKQDPGGANLDLLRRATLARARQLQEEGKTRDAAAVLANAAELGGGAEYLAEVGRRLAACGAPEKALALSDHLPDPRDRQRVLGQVADAALQRGEAGRSLLPPDQQPAFDLVVAAFAHAEAGRDEEARAALQGIGLQSPFLEWKLLLRGLLAWYAGHDAKALENWQRLDPARLPHRAAAPLRLGIDDAFRAAQPPATVAALQRRADRLLGINLAADLRALQHELAPKHSLAGAFRRAEAMLPALRKEEPHLVPRLAQCFFWAVVAHGQPEDVDRYERVFLPGGERGEAHRLEALALERRNFLLEAHDAWRRFLRATDASPAWAGDLGRRARALVWAHMGKNAASDEAALGDHDDSPFEVFFDRRGRPKPLEPDAEACFKRSIELAPDRLEPYLELFQLHLDRDDLAKARKVGQELLKRFPDHAATSEAVGDLHLGAKELDKARAFYEKALAANPLDRKLRGKLGRARQNLAVACAVAGQFDQARAEYDAVASFWEGRPGPLLCQRAVLEMKAKDEARAAGLIAQARAEPDQRLAVAYHLVCESTRAKLPPARRKQLAADLDAALAEPPTPAEVLALFEAAALQRTRHLEVFRGQKTHEKAVLAFLDKVRPEEFDEPQSERLAAGLQALNARRPWERFLDAAEFRFPDNPVFRLSRVDFFLTRRDPERNVYFMQRNLERARGLTEALPRGERQERLLREIKHKEEVVRDLGGDDLGFLGMFGNFFGGGGEY